MLNRKKIISATLSLLLAMSPVSGMSVIADEIQWADTDNEINIDTLSEYEEGVIDEEPVVEVSGTLISEEPEQDQVEEIDSIDTSEGFAVTDISDDVAYSEEPECLEEAVSDGALSDDIAVKKDGQEDADFILEDIAVETDNVESDLEDFAIITEETADEEVLCAAASGITVNAEEITLYYLSGYYPEYISSMPDDLPTSFQIKVSGTDKTPTFTGASSGIEVDNSGLITLSTGNVYHESPGEVKVRIDGELVARIIVNQLSYERYFAEQKVNSDMERLGIRDLGSDYEKVRAICEYISSTYNYSPNSASMTGEVITGGGDCWANSALVSYMCQQCGIPVWTRNANFEPGAGAGHENNIVKIGEDYYIVDCGYTGNAPRHYDFAKASGDFEYFWKEDGTVELESHIRFDTDVITIPAEIDGHKVSSIRTGMLQERSYSKILVEEGSEYFTSRNGALCSADGKTLIACPGKTAGSYTIPDGIEIVGENAFLYCEDITEITMPDSLKTIEESAFTWCKSLSAVNWSNSLESIGESAFSACGSLKNIILPESLRTIGARSFCASMQPEAVYIPSGVTSIGAGAFLNVPFMVVRARDPELGDGAISQCTLFCYPGSTVDNTCSGDHFDINLLDNNNKLVLRKDFFIVDQSDKAYTGSEQITSVRNTDDYKWLKVYNWTWSEDEDRYIYGIIRENYDVTYQNNVDAGTATVLISGKNWCTGTVSYTFTIKPKAVFSSDYYGCRMQFKDTGWRKAVFAYTGEEIRPEIELSQCGNVVTCYQPGRDYILTYSENTNIGYETGTVTLNGTGNYSGTDTIHFTIKGQLPELDAIPDQKYTGNFVTPKVTIPGLTSGTDYIVTYSDNIEIGTATVTVTGIGNYTGTQTITFNITDSDSANHHGGDGEEEGEDEAPTIKLNAYSIPLKVGQSTRKIKVSGLQKGDSICSWSSSNKKIVTVSQSGVIKARKKTGTAYITVRTDYGATASIKVKVQKKKVTAKKILTVKSVALKRGEKYSLNALVTPITTPDKIKYKSAKKKIAAVSGKGVITARKKGKTVITVTCGKKKVKIKVSVR